MQIICVYTVPLEEQAIDSRLIGGTYGIAALLDHSLVDRSLIMLVGGGASNLTLPCECNPLHHVSQAKDEIVTPEVVLYSESSRCYVQCPLLQGASPAATTVYRLWAPFLEF